MDLKKTVVGNSKSGTSNIKNTVAKQIVWETPTLSELDVFETANGGGLNDGNGMGDGGANQSGS